MSDLTDIELEVMSAEQALEKIGRQDAEIIKLTREIAIEQCAQLVQEQREDFSDYDLDWLCDHIFSAIRKLAEE